MPKAGSGLMAGTILCMKSKASCFSSASLPETAIRRFEDRGRGQLSQCRRGADGMAGFSHLPEPTRTYQRLPGATERLLFRTIFIFKGSVGCDRLLWGSDTGDGAPAKARVKIRIMSKIKMMGTLTLVTLSVGHRAGVCSLKPAFQRENVTILGLTLSLSLSPFTFIFTSCFCSFVFVSIHRGSGVGVFAAPDHPWYLLD